MSGWYEIGMIFDDIPESFRRRKPVPAGAEPDGEQEEPAGQ